MISSIYRKNLSGYPVKFIQRLYPGEPIQKSPACSGGFYSRAVLEALKAFKIEPDMFQVHEAFPAISLVPDLFGHSEYKDEPLFQKAKKRIMFCAYDCPVCLSDGMLFLPVGPAINYEDLKIIASSEN